jgi:hypothetical protein
LPSDRFGLIGAPKGITLFERPVEDPAAIEAGERYIASWRAEQGRPMGYARNLKVESGEEIWRLATDRVREFALDRGANLQLPKPTDYARLPWLNPVKARLNLREYRTRRWDPLPERFVFLPLQVQPESSIDVMGQGWRDQAYTARVLADALAPLGIGVAVKEHAHFMWRRDPDYWPQFDLHPNIATVDPFADSRELMRQAVFTVTATGTVGLEAGLLGLPVVTGAPMPWSALENVALLDSPDDLSDFVERRGWEDLHEDQSRIDAWFAHEYVRNSWEGLVLDPPRVPAVLEPENIRRIGAAFEEAASTLGPGGGSACPGRLPLSPTRDRARPGTGLGGCSSAPVGMHARSSTSSSGSARRSSRSSVTRVGRLGTSRCCRTMRQVWRGWPRTGCARSLRSAPLHPGSACSPA